MHEAKKIKLIPRDGAQIAANLYHTNTKKENLIIVAPASGVQQYYYKKFAQFASQNFDFDVLTFDYRGIGKSLFRPIKEDKSRMSEWGSHDMNVAFKWGKKNYNKIFLVGHSVAGQVFPKAQYARSISAAYFVCTQTASMRFWSGWRKAFVGIFWHVVLPLTTKMYGYLPGWVLGGENLPIGVAREWRSWGIHPQGVLQGDQKVKDQFNQLHMPIHFVNIEDDKIFAPVNATHELMHYYGNAITSFQLIRPGGLHIKKLGHFGFFSSSLKEKLWSMPILYFMQYVKSFEEEISLVDKDQ